jgi:hypothetical protein
MSTGWLFRKKSIKLGSTHFDGVRTDGLASPFNTTISTPRPTSSSVAFPLAEGSTLVHHSAYTTPRASYYIK